MKKLGCRVMLESTANILPQLQVKQRTNRRTRKASGGRTPKWRTARREGKRKGLLLAWPTGDLKLFHSFTLFCHALTHLFQKVVCPLTGKYQFFLAMYVLVAKHISVTSYQSPPKLVQAPSRPRVSLSTDDPCIYNLECKSKIFISGTDTHFTCQQAPFFGKVISGEETERGNLRQCQIE